jgi:PleD family two-component response regulator
LGGDEFLLVMSHGEEDATVQTIERLRADWEKERFVFNGRELQATACFGIAGYCGIENRTFVSCSPSQSRAIRS